MFRVEDKGRDHGKTFLLTEMSAAQAENWAMRVLFALMKSDVQLPENVTELGMAGLAQFGLRAISGLEWQVAEPLLAEMFTCIKVIPDPTKTHVSRDLVEDDIEEIQTRFKLRMEVFSLHTDFLQAVVPSIFPAGSQAAKGRRQVTKMSRR